MDKEETEDEEIGRERERSGGELSFVRTLCKIPNHLFFNIISWTDPNTKRIRQTATLFLLSPSSPSHHQTNTGGFCSHWLFPLLILKPYHQRHLPPFITKQYISPCLQVCIFLENPFWVLVHFPFQFGDTTLLTQACRRRMQMAGMQDEGSSSVSSSPLQAFSLMPLSPGIVSPYPLLRELKSEERGLWLIQLLLACANHVASGNIENANICLERISHLASPDGDTMQRIAAYFSHALALRILKAWTGVDKALNSTRIKSVSEGILVQRLFFDLCPFLKLSYLVMNRAIIEALEGEKMVHIIDLNSFEPAQWINLLQLLSARPEGPPHLRITGIHEQKEVLDLMALRLNEEAEKLDIPFQFVRIASKLENLDLEALSVKTGESLVISSVLQLHTLLAADDEMFRRSSPCASNGSNSANLQRVLHLKQRTLGEWLEKDLPPYYPSPDSGSMSSPLSFNPAPRMTNFLNALWGLSPKLMVIAEQESNHNGSNLMERLLEALHYYANVFDCLELTGQRALAERQKLEKMMFGEEIKNIIATEGTERKERHEKLDKWVVRLEMTGFRKVSLSYNGLLHAEAFLRGHGYEGYNLKDEDGCVHLCWKSTPLYSVSAWRR